MTDTGRLWNRCVRGTVCIVTTTDMQIAALHRYFLSANLMRTHFDELLVERRRSGQPADQNSVLEVEEQIFMSQWYAGLCVVVEGWKELHLQNEAVDRLLNVEPGPEMVGLVRRYRNGVYHYQRKYWDNRFTDFWAQGAYSPVWVRELNSALGRWFVQWFAERR